MCQYAPLCQCAIRTSNCRTPCKSRGRRGVRRFKNNEVLSTRSLNTATRAYKEFLAENAEFSTAETCPWHVNAESAEGAAATLCEFCEPARGWICGLLMPKTHAPICDIQRFQREPFLSAGICNLPDCYKPLTLEPLELLLSCSL